MFNQKPMLGQLPDWTRFPQPAALYVMNEGTGSIINDLSGNSNTGTLTGSPVWFGEYITANGDTLATLAKPQTLVVGTIVFIANNANGSVCGNKDIISAQDYIWPRQNSHLRIRDHVGGDAQLAITDFTGVHHYAVSWDGTNARGYKDGILKDTKVLAGSFQLHHLFAGYNGEDWDFIGGLKSLIPFDFVLSAQQIKQLHIDPFPWFRREPAMDLWTPPEDGGIVVLRRRRECA